MLLNEACDEYGDVFQLRGHCVWKRCLITAKSHKLGDSGGLGKKGRRAEIVTGYCRIYSIGLLPECVEVSEACKYRQSSSAEDCCAVATDVRALRTLIRTRREKGEPRAKKGAHGRAQELSRIAVCQC